MKQIEKVSVGGYLFTMDKEAAAETDSYLGEMSAYYSNPEITEGIEERMAELLQERVAAGEVVSKAIILSIIDILGRPENIAGEEPDGVEPDKPAKKLYRDMQNVRLAGVCSGIAAYFNFDPVILRVAFAVLTLVGLFGFAECNRLIVLTAPIIYIILWICIPPARTARERWALKGDDGSVENIRRNIESGANDVGNALRQVGNSPAWGTIGRIIEVCVGLLMLVIAVSGLFAGGLAAFGWEWLGFADSITSGYHELIDEFPNAADVITTPWVMMLVAAVYALPFIGMLYGSIMLLFRIKSPKWKPGLIIFIVWLMSIIALCILIGATMFATAVA